MTIDIWIDGDGKKVEIRPFLISNLYSKLYIDEEMIRLSGQYNIGECDGEQRISSLGKAEMEFTAAQILVLVRAIENVLSLVGVSRAEFEEVLRGVNAHGFLDELIEHGFLREKQVRETLVIFPTEKLLENQRISKSGVAV